MSAFPKYERYKDSGVEWLGEVPEHWEVERLKGILKEVDERSTTGTETLLGGIFLSVRMLEFRRSG
jgi:type I restriction enzyme S subunit